uniref:Protein C n=1 Tax=Dolphin morbillivirus TaxID=37131 RepID=A0A2I7ZG77_9MONO|nr:C protein [Dolphin morbillivirus]
MSIRDLSVSNLSEKIRPMLSKLRKPKLSEARPPAKNQAKVITRTTPKKTLLISTNHALQQLDQKRTACYLVMIQDLEHQVTSLMKESPSQETSERKNLQYDVTMFMITAVKRLKESRMLTCSWFQQVVMMMQNSETEMRALSRAMVNLALLIPEEVLPLTGDLLPGLRSRDRLTLRL